MNKLQYYKAEDGFLTGSGINPSATFGKNITVGLDVIVEENVVVGEDCFIGHHTIILANSFIGDRVIIRSNCLLDPGVTIGNDVSIFPKAIVGGGTIIEDKVYYGPFVLTTNADQIAFQRNLEKKIRPPRICFGAIIAAGCMIKPGVTVGRNSMLGLGSVLTKDIPDGEVWFGNPARFHRKIRKEEKVIEEFEGGERIWPYSVKDLEHRFSE